MAITRAGKVSTTAAPIYICDNREGAVIISMRFNNPDSYDIEIVKFDVATNQPHILYKLFLNGGDTIYDDTPIKLNFGDKLIAQSTRSKTSFNLQIQ